MRKIAIIGSGMAGLLAAHGVRRAGHEVTLFSDRTADQWLRESRPTGAAARFDLALDHERSLGLDHWEHLAPKGRGVQLTICPKIGNLLLTLCAKFSDGSHFQAIDLRLQSHRWMHDLEARGGRVVVEKVDVPRLDAIAAAHDLTLVATGRGPLAELFPRHPGRSVYDGPQRKVSMVAVTHARLGLDGVPFLPVKFNIIVDHGECFWVPYYHKDHGPTWVLGFEAKRGTSMDRFDGCKTGDDVLAAGKGIIRDIMPWDYDWVKNARLADPLGWLVGAVPPTVREPVGRLPSGRVVMPLGDTAASLDPIGGQGANHGSKMARAYVAAIARADKEGRALDERWMRETFEAFWADHGAKTVTFNNLLLEPLSKGGQALMISQYGTDGTGNGWRQRLANAVCDNFVDPRLNTDAFVDVDRARRLVREVSGKPWPRAFASGMARILVQQGRQAIGLPARHPVATTWVEPEPEPKPEPEEAIAERPAAE